MAVEGRDDPPNPYKVPTIRTRMGYSQVWQLPKVVRCTCIMGAVAASIFFFVD